MNVSGTYIGLVEDNKDPLKLGRVKARVSHVHGPQHSKYGAISTADLPWALPVGMPAGNVHESGGITWLPEPGDQVFVRFLNDEPEKPIWEWANQTQAGGTALELHQYGSDKKPSRSALTRYQHLLEFTAKALLLSSKNGNSVSLNDRCDGLLAHANNDLTCNVGEHLRVIANNVDVDCVERVRVSADIAIASTAKNIAACAEEDIIYHAGKSFTVFAGNGSIIKVGEGQITATDGAGSSLVLDGLGNASLAAVDGTNISFEDGKVILTAPGVTENATVVMDASSVSVNASVVYANAAQVVAASRTGGKIELSHGSVGKITIDDTSTRIERGARSITITSGPTAKISFA